MNNLLCHNERLLSTLANLCAGGRLPHALLLEGPSGCGKRTAARYLARLSLCAGKENPCGRCPHCFKAEKDIHPDVRFYTVPEGKKEFPIELVRAIRQDAYIAPNEAACKLYIIDRAHAMNTAAQNALLKIIEEPPAFVRFVLLCENRSMLLPTILSRVTAFELEIPTVEECAQVLARQVPDTPEGERQAAAVGAGGNVGRALGLLGSAKPSKADADARIVCEELLFGERYRALTALAGYDRDREGLVRVLELLREKLAQCALERYRAHVSPDTRVCNRITPMQAIGAARAVETAMRRANQNVGVALVCACMVEEIKSALG